MGIRQLKTEFIPNPYSSSKNGEHVPQPERAEHAAEHLATKQWKTTETEGNLNRGKRLFKEFEFETGEITIDELQRTIKSNQKSSKSKGRRRGSGSS